MPGDGWKEPALRRGHVMAAAGEDDMRHWYPSALRILGFGDEGGERWIFDVGIGFEDLARDGPLFFNQYLNCGGYVASTTSWK